MREGGQTATIGKGAYWLPPLMKPITGSGCCALAASGYAMALPPSRVMNSRRFSWSNCIRSPTSQVQDIELQWAVSGLR
jgi:hypothetical protein